MLYAQTVLKILLLSVAALLLPGLSAPASGEPAASPRIIELHQTACQFIEPEGGDKDYAASGFDACEALNERTGEQRLAAATPIRLTPGAYVFRVHNVDVPYVLGFWLRGTALGRVTLPGVSGGSIKTGSFRDYTIELRKGEYRYSCPLNPTPDYLLLVGKTSK